MGFHPKLWASRIPRDPSYPKPNHYWEMLRVAWRNRDQLPFAWRILSKGTSLMMYSALFVSYLLVS